MEKVILALDQGTTGTTVCIVNHQGQLLCSVNNEHPQIFPRPGWVEHDPEAIWQSVLKGIKEALAQTGIAAKQIAAIGITNQRETVVLWDRDTGKPVYNAIVWQCRRTTDFCKKLEAKGKAKMIRDKTGLVIDPYFSASKIRWLLQSVEGVRQRTKAGHLLVGTIDSYLLWRLTGGKVHATDVSNASRTQLMNIHKGSWDAELCKLFSVPQNILPEIQPSSGEFGHTLGVPGLMDGIPIAGIAGDQQAALFGQACFSAGTLKCTYGTGSFILLNTGTTPVRSKSGLLTTVAWQLRGQKGLTYALEGGAFVCGAAVQWLRDQLQLIKSSDEMESLASEVPTNAGVYVVPAFVGLGAPYWDPNARAAIVGLTRGSSRAHIARATLEAMALQNVDILSAMEKDLKKKIRLMRVDGGAARNSLLLQMQSDFLGQEVERAQVAESTDLGAAFLAGLGVGFWKDTHELSAIWRADQVWQPQWNARSRAQKMAEWHQAVKRVRS